MTRKEAINLIGWLKSKTNRDDDLEAIDKAIEALQREDSLLKSLETNEPIEKQRVCGKCRNRRTSEIVSKCMIDGHYIGYAQCFTNGCRHWATDELKWIGGEDE